VWEQDNGGVRKLIFSAAIVISSFALVATGVQTSFADVPSAAAPLKVSLDSKTATVTVPATSQATTWTITLADPTLATVSGTTLTLLKAGSTEMTFTPAATGPYYGHPRQSLLRITPGTPIVSPWAPLITNITAGKFIVPQPVSTSNGTWAYSLSGTSGIATLSGATVTLLDGGVVTINATQFATNNWLATSTTTTLTINAITPTIGSFTNTTVAKDAISSFSLVPPISNSPGIWTFSIADQSVASISGSTVTPVNVGSTTITAKQAPASGFSSAKATMTLTVTGATASVGSFGPITYAYGSIPNNIIPLTNPTSNSPGLWSYSIADPTVATVSGSTLRVLKPGISTITATQLAENNYNASTPQTVALTVTTVPTYTALPNKTQVFGDPNITITPPTSLSTGAWTLTSSNPAVVAITGTTLSIVGAGTATITLNQAANSYWLAGSTSFTVSVAGLVPTIGTLTPVSIAAGETIATIISPTSNSTGTWLYTSSDPTIVKVVNNSLVGVKVGSTTLSAVQQPAGKYGQSNTVQATVIVTPALIPTPTPVATPTVTPTPTPVVTPVKTPVVKPKVTPKAKPKAKKTAVVPVVKASLAGRTLTVTAKGGKVTVMINGAAAKVGKNKMPVGNDLVIIEFGSKVIYSKVFSVK
jgi:hypothetical protein